MNNLFKNKIYEKYLVDCENCITKCDNVSKGTYLFYNDVQFSEFFEKKIIDLINFNNKSYFAKKCEKEGYPDIVVYDKSGIVFCYIEIKSQRRTFMKVKQFLPAGDLIPSETLALNLSDLIRYFEIKNQEKKPIYIFWVLSERPCILGNNTEKYFYNEVDRLKEIYSYYGDKRKMRRKSGQGDVVNGVHLGVVVNYHFSILELKEIKDINKLNLENL